MSIANCRLPIADFLERDKSGSIPHSVVAKVFQIRNRQTKIGNT